MDVVVGVGIVDSVGKFVAQLGRDRVVLIGARERD